MKKNWNQTLQCGNLWKYYPVANMVHHIYTAMDVESYPNFTNYLPDYFALYRFYPAWVKLPFGSCHQLECDFSNCCCSRHCKDDIFHMDLVFKNSHLVKFAHLYYRKDIFRIRIHKDGIYLLCKIYKHFINFFNIQTYYQTNMTHDYTSKSA